MRFIFFVALIIVFSTLLHAKNLFESRFYELKFSSNNVDDDKIYKINEIKLITLDNILKNILIIEDYLIVKKKLDQNFINLFIKNIVIEQEKIINNNYYSKVKINFDKFKIIEYLREQKLSYVETLPKEFLIIIYENNSIEKNLFSKNNTYYQYLKNNSKDFYKIPNMDANDKYLLNHQDIEDKNINKIKKIVKKYHNIDTIILTSIKIKNSFNYNLYLFSNDELIKINQLNYSDKDLGNLFKIVKVKVLNQWKIENSIQNNSINKITCNIKYFNLKELKEIKKIIQNVSLTKKITLKKISLNLNKYDIYHYGNIDILKNLFQNNRIEIQFKQDQCKIFLK